MKVITFASQKGGTGNTSATSADANAALNDYNDMLKSYGY